MNAKMVFGWLSGLLLLPWLMVAVQADSARLSATTTQVSIVVGKDTEVKIKNASSKLSLANSNSSAVAASVSGDTLKIKGKKVGSSTLTVKDKRSNVQIAVQVLAKVSDDDNAGTPSTGSSDGMAVTPSTLVLIPGQSSAFNVSGASGKISVKNSDSDVASTSISGASIKVKAKTIGKTFLTIRDRTQTAVVQVTVQAATNTGGGGTTPIAGAYTLLAWNDLGMHCMDGDYSVFSILPPYNNLHAQLVSNSSTQVVTQGVSLTYEALADPDGSINSISSTKTNFWQYVNKLFGAVLPLDEGLAGKRTASAVPQPMEYNATDKMFVAEGIPITPYDDAGKKNTYPLVKVVARDSTGKVLAQARVVALTPGLE